MVPSKAPLRLLAEDSDDLAVISAALQDAVCQIGDIAYQASARQLTLALNRYRWENGARTQERVRTGLHAEVEMIDIIAADLSSPWSTPTTPKHDLT